MQKLRITNFLGIKNAEIGLDGLTVLIGPQASGKSIIARLIYFCNEYFADFDEISLMKNEHKRTYDARKKEVFLKIFPSYSWHEDGFDICYSNDRHQLNLKSKAGSSSLELSTSESVALEFRALKKSFQDYSGTVSSDSFISQARLLRDFRSHTASNPELLRYEHSLFVPAARSFYATIREEIFSILSIDEKIDQIIMQFGEFYEAAKNRLSFEFLRAQSKNRRGSAEPQFREYFDAIVRGRYVQIDGRDWIEMDRGRIEMSKASSGQQEAFPLLTALAFFPAEGRTLVIEEPEAHLFPESQVKILEFIALQTVSRSTDTFITTHSPYILSALNNLMMRERANISGGIPANKVQAFSVISGNTESIIDTGVELISSEFIDSVSEKIELEFSELVEAIND